MVHDCSDFRTRLDAAFDSGVPAAAWPRAQACEACETYRERLSALSEAMPRLPLETPPPRLLRDISARVAREPAVAPAAGADDFRWSIRAAALIACALVAGLAWYYPIPTDWARLFDGAAVAFKPDLKGLESTAHELVRDASELLQTPVFSSLSNRALWSAAAIATVAMLLANGIELWRARINADNRRTRRWS